LIIEIAAVNEAVEIDEQGFLQSARGRLIGIKII
jgi:hypothetical protein